MHWYDEYIAAYQQDCWDNAGCDRNCEYCEVFQDDISYLLGYNERIWPYDYSSHEEYIEACAFANEADFVVEEEEALWWCGNSGTFESIRSPDVDPRDFESDELYKKALYRHLFSEVVSRYPFIPYDEFWYRVFVGALKDTESLFCAEKFLLSIFEELDYSESLPYARFEVITEKPIHDIRYSSWDKGNGIRRTYNYKTGMYEHAKDFIKDNYTSMQFRSDVFRYYPELYPLIYRSAISDAIEAGHCSICGISLSEDPNQSRAENAIQKYIMEIIGYALYLEDLCSVSVEDSVSDGVVGLLSALRAVNQSDISRSIRIRMIQDSAELIDYFGVSIDRIFAKEIEAIVFRNYRVEDISPHSIACAKNSYFSANRYEDANYFVEHAKRFVNGKAPRMIAQSAELGVEYDAEEELCSSEAIALLRHLVEQLPERERSCISKRFGLDGNAPETLEEIAAQYGCTREWARQIEKKALASLRKVPGFADLCELTENPIPLGAKHMPRSTLGEIDRKTNTGKPHRIEIKDCELNFRLYVRLKRQGITYVDELLQLPIEQLQEICDDVRWWGEAALRLEDLQITLSEALQNYKLRYRPPTERLIVDCGFSNDSDWTTWD